MEIAIWFVVAWLSIGAVVTWATWNPEQDGWLWAIILWPAQLASKFL